MADYPDDTDDDVAEQLDALDTLDDGVADPLDAGWSPAERPWAVGGSGLTAREASEGESLDARLAREQADGEPYEWDGIGDTTDTDGEPLDDEVGGARSGRLLALDNDLVAVDVGIDGAAASAEEAAVHLIERLEPESRGW